MMNNAMHNAGIRAWNGPWLHLTLDGPDYKAPMARIEVQDKVKHTLCKAEVHPPSRVGFNAEHHWKRRYIQCKLQNDAYST